LETKYQKAQCNKLIRYIHYMELNHAQSHRCFQLMGE
jgi:hypothetical protein